MVSHCSRVTHLFYKRGTGQGSSAWVLSCSSSWFRTTALWASWSRGVSTTLSRIFVLLRRLGRGGSFSPLPCICLDEADERWEICRLALPGVKPWSKIGSGGGGGGWGKRAPSSGLNFPTELPSQWVGEREAVLGSNATDSHCSY